LHWRTFERLVASHDAHANAALAGMAVKLGLLKGRLSEIDHQIDRWRQR
jgi:hypothetical protein